MTPGARILAAAAVLSGAALLAAFERGLITLKDFHLSGTQIGDVDGDVFLTSDTCSTCHGHYDPVKSPHSSWSGSLMAHAGRDPLFFAQMTNANQDVGAAGYFCMRCHVPMSMVTGHAAEPDGSTLDDVDRDGVSCHFCHSMVDPIYKPGTSPAADEAILDALEEVPSHYGNAMFVLDPTGTRRGPYEDGNPPHKSIMSPFHRSGDFCGTCHDVGNVAITRRRDGTYWYNATDKPVPDENPAKQFPLERTYTEWRLSEFAKNGVDMDGRYGSKDPVSTCQDCHMPRTVGKGCAFGSTRTDLALHDFAGATSWVLKIVGIQYKDDPAVDLEALARGRAKANRMLSRAATLTLRQERAKLLVRVTNETGHKLPTGHIEGRRAFLTVKIFDAAGALLREYGHYDEATAELDESSTRVYEMHVGLSDEAAAHTGLPPGRTTHMALADTIVKDNRIPPRGFRNATYAAAGAPVVDATYADGQYWDEASFAIPLGAARATVTLRYQTVTAEYIEALRDGNVTDEWGEILHGLWERTDKAPPLTITSARISLQRSVDSR